jgi:hypothetical protein
MFGIGCDKVPYDQEGSDWTSRRVVITTNRPSRVFGVDRWTCSKSDTVHDCLTPGDSLGSGIAGGGRIAFKRTLLCGGRNGLTFTAQITLRDSNNGEQTFQLPVRGPCAGHITLKGVPKRCTSRNFKVKVRVPAALRSLLLDATYGGNDEPVIAVQVRGGRMGGADQVGFFSLRNFSVKIPARRLRAGRYALSVGLESNSPEDYPAVTVPFKRC